MVYPSSCTIQRQFLRANTRFTRAIARFFVVVAGALASIPVLALGTDAGREIQNTAQASFSVDSVPQTPVSSNSTQTYVDELLDVAVVSDDGGPVAVSSPQTGAVLQFTVTNTGNGDETFRLVADDTVLLDDFNPAVVQIYLETNGLPGLQTGGGGDTSYLAGSNDPLLAADDDVTVYVVADITSPLNQNDEGNVELRAVSGTLYVNAGTDDPASLPPPGTSYVGAGDPDDGGSGNVTAVVGSSYGPATPLLLASGVFRVTAAVVSMTKSAITVLDPFGGTTLVPGTLVTYQIDVTVTGSGSADGLTISDPLPADLEYQPGTLSVSALPAGEEADDDFIPLGTDNTGYDGGSDAITVNLGDVPGGGGVITITFDTAIR